MPDDAFYMKAGVHAGFDFIGDLARVSLRWCLTFTSLVSTVNSEHLTIAREI